jgi:hypothetical protein
MQRSQPDVALRIRRAMALDPDPIAPPDSCEITLDEVPQDVA